MLRLVASVVNATPSERSEILAHWRDSKGSDYTEALAQAASVLAGDAQQETRAALAKRLVRMTPATLHKCLEDENREIRLGAATACGLKEDKQSIPVLISALLDSDSFVAKAAQASLKSLSGKNFGPAPDATNDGKLQAVLAWKAWWNEQSK